MIRKHTKYWVKRELCIQCIIIFYEKYFNSNKTVGESEERNQPKNQFIVNLFLQYTNIIYLQLLEIWINRKPTRRGRPIEELPTKTTYLGKMCSECYGPRIAPESECWLFVA